METTETKFISKYALSMGILEGWVKSAYGNGYGPSNSQVYSRGYASEKHAHSTRADAVVMAEKIRTAKINSLKKQILKLEALSFKPKNPANGPSE